MTIRSRPIVSRILLAVVTFALLAGASACARVAAGTESNPSRAAQIEHGRYLVHDLGMCIDCHSPRNEKGEFLPGKHLTGAVLGFAPKVPMPWMPAAPSIAGLPAGYSEGELVHFLMSGERPRNLPPTLPPMPPYRLNKADAQAVAAYLKSLAGV